MKQNEILIQKFRGMHLGKSKQIYKETTFDPKSIDIVRVEIGTSNTEYFNLKSDLRLARSKRLHERYSVQQ